MEQVCRFRSRSSENGKRSTSPQSSVANRIVGEENNDREQSDTQITDCGDGTYCCGAEDDGCCADQQGVSIVDGKPTPISRSSTSSAIPSTSSAIPSTSSALPTATGASPLVGTPDTLPSQQPSNTGTKVGIGVGVGVGVSVIVVLVLVGIWLRKRKRGVGAREGHKEKEHDLVSSEHDTGNVAEIDGDGVIAELEDKENASVGELDGNGIATETRPSKMWVELE
ncbi:MAG: hypothetical protein Q9211_005760 [Gyalolechia sp. 1 TL-2023]